MGVALGGGGGGGGQIALLNVFTGHELVHFWV